MQFSKNSRVWIYQSDKKLSDDETTQIQQHLDAFTTQWTAHNNQLKAKAEIRYNRFFILANRLVKFMSSQIPAKSYFEVLIQLSSNRS